MSLNMIFSEDCVYPESGDTLKCWESVYEIQQDIESLISINDFMEE